VEAAAAHLVSPARVTNGTASRRLTAARSHAQSPARRGYVFLGAAVAGIALFVGRNAIGAANQEAFMRGSRLLVVGFALLSVLGVFASLARGKVHG
jgi:hypothetical protein